MCFKIFCVLIVSLWVVQCSVVNRDTRPSSRPTSEQLQKETLSNLIFPTVINRKSRIHEKNLLRTRRQAFKTRQSRGWPASSSPYYNSYYSRPMSNSNNGRDSDSSNSNEQNQEPSSIHNVNWDNIHVISFNRARGRPPTTSDYGESGEKRNYNGYQTPNYQYESTNRRQNYGDNVYGDNSDSSSNTNPRRTNNNHDNENERRHGFTASLERHYDSEHELEFSDHDIKRDKDDSDDGYSQRRAQVLPRPQRTYDQIYRNAYDANDSGF